MTAAGVLSERKPDESPAPPGIPAAMPERAADSASEQRIQLTDLAELPRPSPASDHETQGAWQRLSSYAVSRATALAAGEDVESALLEPGSAVSLQARKRACTDREPAVLIDIDPGEATFVPPAALAPEPAAIDALNAMREAGLAVLWISRASADDVTVIAEALKNSGLDPAGRDPILLALNEDDRKQTLREQANEVVCALAIAGDERSDFDELFDYLRDPSLATMYDSLMGAGWFIVPPVLAEAPAGQ